MNYCFLWERTKKTVKYLPNKAARLALLAELEKEGEEDNGVELAKIDPDTATEDELDI